MFLCRWCGRAEVRVWGRVRLYGGGVFPCICLFNRTLAFDVFLLFFWPIVFVFLFLVGLLELFVARRFVGARYWPFSAVCCSIFAFQTVWVVPAAKGGPTAKAMDVELGGLLDAGEALGEEEEGEIAPHGGDSNN